MVYQEIHFVKKIIRNRAQYSQIQDFQPALQEFYQLLKETGRRGKFWTPTFDQLRKKAEIFGTDAALFLAYSQSHTPLAGTFVLLDDGTHSASSQEGQDLYASYFLLWETFKKKFGGKEVEYPRPLIKYYHPFVKFIFKIAGA